ncbi:Cockayne syndrome protein [Operophtera brumata]|uniref:DNA repair and recombination protein RAD54-like n=1 Tax=Operophtera brumata TaxID=104452 RepID=A0A0L7LLZ6_OPEBR|nr:Cockayne syndrome protein [Operophtera brumata]
MVDINKYLESQLALANQRENKASKKDNVSQKSKSAAENISKKQARSLNKSSHKDSYKASKQCEKFCTEKPSTSNNVGSDEDCEYLPSDEDETADLPLVATSRTKQNVKRIIDDGDIDSYNDRIRNWRDGITAASSGKFEGDNLSADIKYILDGNKNPEEKHELQNGLCIPNFIWKQLYKFQRTGVKWLWELHQVDAGGLLGDEMGLGKTIQIIAFLSGLANSDIGSWGGLGPSIIVAPATVIYQWVSHFHYWCPHLRVAVLHHTGSHAGNHNQLIRDLHGSHGIVLITYAGVVKYSKDLMSRKWHYIILDEGHKIRNPDTQVSKLIKQFQTPHKLIATGCPMQNSLQELWSLFDFMRPGLLGTYAAFMEHFAQPITQGGYANATEFQEATALEIAKALKSLITPYMLRRTKAEVQDNINLPEKNEQVLFCALTQEQRDLYMGYLMSGTVRSILDKDNKYGEPVRARMLVALMTLRKMCNHPDLYLYEAQDDIESIDEEKFGHWKRSGKMTVVNSLLKIWQKQGHRTLIFSQSRAMLCVLEQYLLNQGFKYLKMDGSVGVGQRQSLIKTFNDNSEYLVFLATTRVGGLGVNLTGADRVIIYDPDWNPATDDQAKERAWRIGQQRSVTVYRLLSAGTIEEKIYQRQIFKHFLSNKILVDPNQKNVLTTSTLQGLFTLEEPNCDGDTETASLFKHTKVNIDSAKAKKDHMQLKKDLSTQKKKVAAMKRMAKEISNRISRNAKKEPEVDPREEYKKKRDLMLNPPEVVLPEINLVDDNITEVPFENVLSEIDIVNMHVKKDYEEKLLKEVLKKREEEEEGEIVDDEDQTEKFDNKSSDINNIDGVEPITKNPEHIQNSRRDPKVDKHKNPRKRKHSKSESVSEAEVENLVAIKKVKKKKHQKEKDKDGKKQGDDDYVLSKLFAKSSVKSALHHDEVVGLAEKEKRHRMKEEATKRAKDAVRAIKFSSK